MATTSVIGVQELYYAPLLTDSGTTTYGTPARLGFVQELNITPNMETVVQYGDNKVIESASAMGGIEVEMTLTGILPVDEAAILGHQSSNGIIIKDADRDIAPYVALMYKRLMSDGKYRYKVLYKGKFSLPEEANKTREDSVEFQGTTLAATFIPRLSDYVYEYQIDSGITTGAAATTAMTNWFTAVQSPILHPTV